MGLQGLSANSRSWLPRRKKEWGGGNLLVWFVYFWIIWLFDKNASKYFIVELKKKNAVWEEFLENVESCGPLSHFITHLHEKPTLPKSHQGHTAC